MNQVIIDRYKFLTLLSAFDKKAEEDGLFKHEKAFFAGGSVVLRQILIDNNLTEVIYEELPGKSE